MKRAIAVAIALACAACGGSETPVETTAEQGASAPAPGGVRNEAPTIEDALLTPDPASASDPVGLQVKIRDTERDRLTTTVEWYVNGAVDTDLTGTIVDAGTFHRGDRVYAVVYVADRTHDVKAQTP